MRKLMLLLFSWAFTCGCTAMLPDSDEFESDTSSEITEDFQVGVKEKDTDDTTAGTGVDTESNDTASTMIPGNGTDSSSAATDTATATDTVTTAADSVTTAADTVTTAADSDSVGADSATTTDSTSDTLLSTDPDTLSSTDSTSASESDPALDTADSAPDTTDTETDSASEEVPLCGDVGTMRSCIEDGLFGTCAAGTQLCQLDGTWSECSILPEANDSCVRNNDDNCNGVLNDNPECDCLENDSRPCSEGGYLGNCAAGVQFCTLEGKWTECDILPDTDLGDSCDVLDDDADCNGVPNDWCECLTSQEPRLCSEGGALGNCAVGEQTCIDGFWSDCSIPAADDDLCDPGDDANCDGTQNSGCPCLNGVDTDVCGPPNEQGICSFGVRQCVDGEWGAECDGAVYAGPRICASAADNDCNGSVDYLEAPCELCQGAPETIVCDEHPQDGIGTCRAGEQTLIRNLSECHYSACENAVGPNDIPELCGPSEPDRNCNGINGDGAGCSKIAYICPVTGSYQSGERIQDASCSGGVPIQLFAAPSTSADIPVCTKAVSSGYAGYTLTCSYVAASSSCTTAGTVGYVAVGLVSGYEPLAQEPSTICQISSSAPAVTKPGSLYPLSACDGCSSLNYSILP